MATMMGGGRSQHRVVVYGVLVAHMNAVSLLRPPHRRLYVLVPLVPPVNEKRILYGTAVLLLVLVPGTVPVVGTVGPFSLSISSENTRVMV